MTLRASLVAFPWDLWDEGVETVLDRLQGELGIAGVVLWGATPPVTQLRVRKLEPRVFRTRGGVFFQPLEEHYQGTRCKPAVSTWVKSRDPLTKIAHACDERGMPLRVKLSAALTGRLAQRHPEMGCKNVFGCESHLAVCLANPDVQAYLCGLVADLSANHKLAGVAVTDFLIGWQEALSADPQIPGGLGEAERWLLARCFCESCHQRATACGVDVDQVRRSTQVMLESSLERGEPIGAGPEAILADNASLAAYHDWLTGELAALFRRLAEACAGELLLDRGMDRGGELQHERIDLRAVGGVITRVERFHELPAALCRDARQSELCLPASLAQGRRGTDLVSALQQAAELGFAGVEIDHLGQLPDAALSTIKQAIRLARRTTTE